MATDRSSVTTKKFALPNAGVICLVLKTDASPVATDTIAITLASYGASNLLGFQSYVHTTDLSVIVTEVVTSAVSGGVATFTIPSGNDSKRRAIVVWAE